MTDTGTTPIADEGQTHLVEPEETEPPSSDNVFVVVSVYDGSPHPRVEGVYSNREAAEAHRDACASITEPPHPVAWELRETPVADEYRNEEDE